MDYKYNYVYIKVVENSLYYITVATITLFTKEKKKVTDFQLGLQPTIIFVCLLIIFSTRRLVKSRLSFNRKYFEDYY